MKWSALAMACRIKRPTAIAVATLLCLSSIMPSFAATKTEVLQPKSKWVLSWEKDSCLLLREFGSADDVTTLLIEQFAPGPSFQLLLTSDKLRNLEHVKPVSLSYGDGRGHDIEYPLWGSSKDKRGTLFVPRTSLVLNAQTGLPTMPSLQSALFTNSISLSWRNKVLTLNTGPMDRVFAELNKCTEDMFRVWNLDSKEQRNLSAFAAPTQNPGTWMRPNDYPSIPNREGQQALISFVLLVGADGVPTECRIQRSYGDDIFKTRSCDLLMRRARFTPARNANGEPVASTYWNVISWVIR